MKLAVWNWRSVRFHWRELLEGVVRSATSCYIGLLATCTGEAIPYSCRFQPYKIGSEEPGKILRQDIDPSFLSHHARNHGSRLLEHSHQTAIISFCMVYKQMSSSRFNS